MSGIVRTVETIVCTRRGLNLGGRAMLVGISGIDGSGKTWLSTRVADELTRRGVSVALFRVDGWLNLPAVRFGPSDPGRTFLDHGLRLTEMFRDVVLPLRDQKSIDVEVDHLEETATAFARRRYRLANVDIVLVEGIFLLQQRFRPLFDLAFWVDCSFETALARAITRSQEGLGREETIRAYETIYFPAQRLHFERDAPRDHADRIINNDFRPAPDHLYPAAVER